ncbi:MAG: hypothetical protein AAF696_02060 [Bacteroidota bacterium]
MRPITMIWLCLLCLFPWELQSQVLPVKITRMRVMERKLEGFQVIVRKPLADVKKGIKNYFVTYDVLPVVFEDLLIYERVDYPPVSVSQPISFFYQLEDISGLMTRLSLVGMYDYQSPITVHAMPDLSLRLLLDLGKLIEIVSGDTLNFDPLFQETNATEIRQKYEERKSQFVYADVIERKRDWVGDMGETRIKKDPFHAYQAPEMEEDEAIVEQISSRFQDYLKQQSHKATQYVEESGAEQIRLYRDSLFSLHEEMDIMRASLIRASLKEDSLQAHILAIDQPKMEKVPLDTLLDMPLNEPELAENIQLVRQEKLDSIQLENKQLRSRIAESEQQLITLKSFQKRQDSVLKKYQSDIAQAQELGDPKARVTQLEAERKELYQVQEADRDLIQILREKLSEQEVIHKRNQQRILSLKDSFQQEIAMLNPDSEAARMRRQVYLKQQKELEKSQIELEEREWEVKIRETRIAQREKFLAEFELKSKEAQLMQRIVELEERIDQLNQERFRREDQGKGKNYSLRIDPASTSLEGNTIPAFAVKSDEAPALLREQILEWTRLKNIEVQDEENEIMLNNISLPELSAERMSFRFSFSLQNSGKSLIFVSMKEGANDFIKASSNSLRSRKAYALLVQIFE